MTPSAATPYLHAHAARAHPLRPHPYWAHIMCAHVMQVHTLYNISSIVCFTTQLTATCQLSLPGQDRFNTDMPTQFVTSPVLQHKLACRWKLTASCQLSPVIQLRHAQMPPKYDRTLKSQQKGSFFLGYHMSMNGFMYITRWHLKTLPTHPYRKIIN
jgi:hypothetical protein